MGSGVDNRPYGWWRKRDTKAHVRRRTLRQYGLTDDEYLEMAQEQDFRCAICGRHETEMDKLGLCVDHDHQTGEVRKLLCAWCNKCLGWYEKNKASVDLYPV